MILVIGGQKSGRHTDMCPLPLTPHAAEKQDDTGKKLATAGGV